MPKTTECDVAIVGGGPAGLSAAVVLGRCRRRTLLLDDARPRNYAARHVNCYLGVEGASPDELRRLGRQQAEKYGVQLVDGKVVTASCEGEGNGFTLTVQDQPSIRARKLLLATGVRDVLPVLENLEDFYGTSVHHCPYCDGWEHRDQRLVALGRGNAGAGLALLLRQWSSQVTACTCGVPLDAEHREKLARAGVALHNGTPRKLCGHDCQLEQIEFDDGPPLPCDAMFFNADQTQRSPLAETLGCGLGNKGAIETANKQRSGVPGLFIAGDADGDVQFAIVAAAEGAIAATAINRELQEEDQANLGRA